MSACGNQSRFMRGVMRASLALAFAIAIQAAAIPASAQTPSSAIQFGVADHLSLLALLDDGLKRAHERAGPTDQPALLTLGSRDTLYLYDMVHGNVKVIATSPNGGLIRRISALRLLAGSWRSGGVTGSVATPQMLPARGRTRG